MKKIILIIAALVAVGGVAFWIFHDSQSPAHEQHTQYTCPMHPQIISDKPGTCPICGMNLVPVVSSNDEKQKKMPNGTFVVSPERRQLIGVKTETVSEKPLHRKAVLPGQIAYDQELYVTENEYVEGLKQGNEAEVMQAIVAKMKRLGISDEEIVRMKQTGKADEALFMPRASNPFWVYASLYEIDWNWIQPKMKAVIRVPYDKSIEWEGIIQAVTPILDPITRTAKARILVSPKGEKFFKPETYVDVTVEKDLGNQLAIPESAVIDTGTRQIAFIDLGDGYLQPREIRVGAKAGDDYPVIEGLTAEEKVVTSANFLIDSESQLKAALAQMGEKTPAGHQH